MKEVNPSPEEVKNNGEGLNLDDVGGMVMVGVKKNGEPFVHGFNTSDLFILQGFVTYAQKYLDWQFAQQIAGKKETEGND